MHRRFVRYSILVAAIVTACSDSGNTTSPAPVEDAATAAQQFDHLADSLSASVSAEAAAPYRGMADLVRQAGQITAVTLHIDKEDVAFSAIAQETILSGNIPCPAPPIAIPAPGAPGVCPIAWPLTTRALIAWQPKKPAPLLQLLAVSQASNIGLGGPSQPGVLPALPATLQYFDGSQGFWWATSGTQSNSMTLGGACPTPTPAPGAHPVNPPQCTLATFTWQFAATVAPILIPVKGNTATGTHTISMAKTTVAGAQLKITLPPPPPPSPLKGKLTATVGSAVALSFVVTNPTDVAVTVSFPSSQLYDFWVVDKATGKEIWRWSAGKAFTMMWTTKAIPAHGTLTYSETWTPTVHGAVVAHASLKAIPSATADVTVTVP